jgi:hypothetical protein
MRGQHKQHDDRDTTQLGIRQQAPVEYTFRQEAQPGSWARHFLKSHLISDSFADVFSTLEGHTASRHSRCQTTRFQDKHIAELEQSRRHSRGLSGARRRLNHQARFLPQRRENRRDQRIDGKWCHDTLKDLCPSPILPCSLLHGC